MLGSSTISPMLKDHPGSGREGDREEGEVSGPGLGEQGWWAEERRSQGGGWDARETGRGRLWAKESVGGSACVRACVRVGGRAKDRRRVWGMVLSEGMRGIGRATWRAERWTGSEREGLAGRV